VLALITLLLASVKLGVVAVRNVCKDPAGQVAILANSIDYYCPSTKAAKANELKQMS